MDSESQVIRQDIEETRSELTRKLETLENEVMGTVRGTTAAMADTVETVKESVENTVENVRDTIQDTVQSVKDTFDVKRQMYNHPWPMLGGSVLAGFMLGTLLPPARRGSRNRAERTSYAEPAYQAEVARPLGRRSEPERAPRRSFLSGLVERFQPEMDQLKSVAIGAAVGMIHDAIKGQIPASLTPHVNDVIHNITAKLGGQEIKGPILAEETGRGDYAMPR